MAMDATADKGDPESSSCRVQTQCLNAFGTVGPRRKRMGTGILLADSDQANPRVVPVARTFNCCARGPRVDLGLGYVAYGIGPVASIMTGDRYRYELNFGGLEALRMVVGFVAGWEGQTFLRGCS